MIMMTFGLLGGPSERPTQGGPRGDAIRGGVTRGAHIGPPKGPACGGTVGIRVKQNMVSIRCVGHTRFCLLLKSRCETWGTPTRGSRPWGYLFARRTRTRKTSPRQPPPRWSLASLRAPARPTRHLDRPTRSPRTDFFSRAGPRPAAQLLPWAIAQTQRQTWSPYAL